MFLSRPRARDTFYDPFVHVERLLNLPIASDTASHADSLVLSGPFAKGVHIDVAENDKSYVVEADIPGVKKDEVSVTIKDNVLKISGERSSTKEDKNEHMHVVERSFGSFSRSIRLPVDANPDGIAASMEHGVLKLTIEKKVPPEETPKKILIA